MWVRSVCVQHATYKVFLEMAKDQPVPRVQCRSAPLPGCDFGLGNSVVEAISYLFDNISD